jgi:acyl phosphate:glycerol-3-phosphate acyltransferase
VSDTVILALSSLLCYLVGYLIGSIPVANIVASRSGGVDLRTVGDRNPGFWNAMQTLGGRRSSIVFVGDAAKGTLSGGIAMLVLLGATSSERWWIGYVAVGAAMVGHAFPIFDGFRGGRSVLTFAGGMVVLAPIAALLAIAIIGVLSAVTRNVPRAIRLGVAAFPVIQILIEGPYRTAATGVLMTFIGLRFAMAARNSPDLSTPDAAA